MKSSIAMETMFGTNRSRCIAVALAVLALSWQAFATLGDTSDSVRADQAQMKASLRIIQASAYTIHELTSPNGTVVREYVSGADGRVFGVTWQGPFTPDMRQLLGNHFQQFSQAAQAQRESHAGRHPLNIQESGLVVQTAGHMRAFFGRAYDPGLLPAGVSADEIR
jgi:hypothetical protein